MRACSDAAAPEGAAPHPNGVTDVLLVGALQKRATRVELSPAGDGAYKAAIKRGKRTLAYTDLAPGLGKAVVARFMLLAELDLANPGPQTGRCMVREGQRLVDLFVVASGGVEPSLEVKVLDEDAVAPAAMPGDETVPAALPNVLPRGTRIGPYVVTGVLGRGGMGIVYRGEHTLLLKPVAIKVLDRKHLARDRAASGRFLKEARAAAQVRHDSIVDVADIATLPDGRPYLVMELLEGRSLADVIDEEGPMDPARAVALCRRVAEALAAAHDAGVIHRDLSPGNIFLQGEGDERIKLVDFGAAELQGQGSEGLPENPEDVVVGTPWYMAPEQARGHDTDGRADLYSLGVILFELLSGKVPFDGDTARDVLIKHVTVPAPLVAAPSGTLPPELVQLVARLLRKDPAQRPSSARDLLAALDGLNLEKHRSLFGRWRS